MQKPRPKKVASFLGAGRWAAALAPARWVPYHSRVREERGTGHVRIGETHARQATATWRPWHRWPCLSLSDGQDAPSRAPRQQPPATARCIRVLLEGARGVRSHRFTPYATATRVGSFTELPKQLNQGWQVSLSPPPENPRSMCMTHRVSWCARVDTYNSVSPSRTICLRSLGCSCDLDSTRLLESTRGPWLADVSFTVSTLQKWLQIRLVIPKHVLPGLTLHVCTLQGSDEPTRLNQRREQRATRQRDVVTFDGTPSAAVHAFFFY